MLPKLRVASSNLVSRSQKLEKSSIQLDFTSLALEHIVIEDYHIWDDEFSLSEIDPKKLNHFFEMALLGQL